MSGSATEEAQFVVETALSFLRHQLTIFPKFRGKVGSGLLQVIRRALALGRAGIVVLLFGLGFARLVIGFGGIRFVDLLPEELEMWVSRESSPLCSQYQTSIAWTSLRSPARVF